MVFNGVVYTRNTAESMHSDEEVITHLGGPTKLAATLGLTKRGSVQRVQNWKVRGIPSKVRLDHQGVFKAAEQAVANPPTPTPTPTCSPAKESA